jgi:two-component system response regulator MprA
MPTILVVDDDRKLTEMLRRTLAYAGYDVITAGDGRAALMQERTQRPDLVVLDWMLPELDGIAVAEQIRARSDTPILMLTARDTIPDRVTGLDSGADDYLVKPFAPEELLARVRALLRRAELIDDDTPLIYADVALDPLTHVVSRAGRAVTLTSREFDLLMYLMRHPREVLPRDRIIEAVWGFDGSDEVLDVYIGYLRAKLEAGAASRLIHTVRGVGYVLREPAV